MKKLLVSLFVVFSMLFTGISFAEEGGAYFKWGALEFTYPLSNASAIALYDFWKAEGLMGVETRLAKWLRLNLNFGAVTSFNANGMPFASIDYDWGEVIDNLPPTLTKIGFWYGHDFKANEDRAGIKATVPIW